MNGLDCFSGIGGITLALRDWVRPIAYCENDRYAQSVLLQRIVSGDLPSAPIWDDITTLSGDMLPKVDIIYGGFPCQDISAAGRGVGLDGKRSGLYWELHRLVREIKPTFVFLENVPAIRARGLREVVGSLASIGYDCRWTIVSAAEVGAPHLRKRWFLLGQRRPALADTDYQGSLSASLKRVCSKENQTRTRDGQLERRGRRKSPALADSKSIRRKPLRYASDAQIQRTHRPQDVDNGSGQVNLEDSMRERWDITRPERSGETNSAGPCGESSRPGWWTAEPDVGGVTYGISSWLDKTREVGDKMAQRIIRYAAQTKGRPEEVLQALREGIDAETVQQSFRGQGLVSPQTVLQSCLLGVEARGFDLTRVQLAGEETLDGEVRGVSIHQKATSPPRRSKSGKQSVDKHPNTVQDLSRLLALDAEAAWSTHRWANASPILNRWSSGWEDGFARVASGVELRTDRLRSLGNAVVPLQAKTAFERLIGYA